MLHFSLDFAVTFELICSIIQIRSDIQKIVNGRWLVLSSFETKQEIQE